MTDELPAPAQELPSEPAPELDVPAAAEPAAEATAAQDMPPPAPKRKGRPTGAKDAVKRVRSKPVVQVRIEPINPEPEPREATPRPKKESVAEPVVEQPVEIEEQPSPRTMLKEASRHFVALRSMVHENRRVSHASQYTQKLTAWPV